MHAAGIVHLILIVSDEDDILLAARGVQLHNQPAPSIHVVSVGLDVWVLHSTPTLLHQELEDQRIQSRHTVDTDSLILWVLNDFFQGLAESVVFRDCHILVGVIGIQLYLPPNQRLPLMVEVKDVDRTWEGSYQMRLTCTRRSIEKDLENLFSCDLHLGEINHG